MATPVIDGEYDRTAELEQFDGTKAGVKGLVDAGITKVPRIFHHSPEGRSLATTAKLSTPSGADADLGLEVPVIDLQDDMAVSAVRRATEEWGLFQVVGHGIPESVLDAVLEGIKGFHEEDLEVKAKFYGREKERKVKYAANFDLFQSKAANWRDTLTCSFDDGIFDPSDLPAVCREAVMDYREHVIHVAKRLCALLSEALGLNPDFLHSDMNCVKTQLMVGHYYPPCPEPLLTMGTSTHTDPSFLTILVQDELGGLQVLHRGRCIDVSPIRGALVVNAGDLLQLVSNDKFISPKHHVLASSRGPRMSVAMFFTPRFNEQKIYGPIKELLSEQNPSLYRDIHIWEYVMGYVRKGLSSSMLDNFRLKSVIGE